MSGPRLKENYVLAKCCSPHQGDSIVGYYSQDGVVLKVHRADCTNLEKAPVERLVPLEWDDILARPEPSPGADFDELDELAFRILALHQEYGVDYSLKVARMLHAEKQTVFDWHNRLRKMGLLKRVEPLIIQYRKGIVDNKWIKHRNHTYYDLTDRGRAYAEHYSAKS